MRVVIFCVAVTLIVVFCQGAPCDSTYEEWSDWTTCDKDCGFCGTQTRSRVCTAISGCAEVTCVGDAEESQACSTTDVICLAPSPSCCPHTYKKMADIPARRFYCGLV